MGKEYIILGCTPSDFIKEHGSSVFNMVDLVGQFRQVCDDYGDPLVMSSKSKAVEFAAKIMYVVGPESRKVKKADGDKVWKFKFMYNLNNKLSVKTAFVCTFKSTNTIPAYNVKENKIILTIKQASLLAIQTLELINEISTASDAKSFLLTPLAGAVFSKDDISQMMGKTKRSLSHSINIINASCQSGGQYLKNSRAATAIIAAIVATRRIVTEPGRFLLYY